MRDLSDTRYVYFFGESICRSVMQADRLYLLVNIDGIAHESKERVTIEDDYRVL
ncbi:MAG: hypothetical protein ACTS7E_01640 [Arsenophonus sp. NC-CH8-MAG3]